MTITVIEGNPRNPRSTALLQASHALMQSLYDPTSCHFLSIDALCVPTITFFEAQVDGMTLGCAALSLKGDYAEVKSMFVDPAARGQGLGDHLMLRLIQQARAQGLAWMRLETGTGLDAAHALYHRHGFTNSGPFGDYREHPDSVFMELPLS
ncbi:GNAT family N-acetyltransferase [Donghicola sp. C2-DW-16]|uniref:GNAT family N-acetyltransferase n=1 Tax=Donghicola mangrovi TaxID=2729614 RepID=A0ABX2PHQ5_9RHOB|nr:GNAT family N-acetyltransferase [Donghicola mangrovi]NVO28715.1 GNAT family N-acetyltransferase [Donghicola mangrovi]